MHRSTARVTRPDPIARSYGIEGIKGMFRVGDGLGSMWQRRGHFAATDRHRYLSFVSGNSACGVRPQALARKQTGATEVHEVQNLWRRGVFVSGRGLPGWYWT